MSDYFPRGTQRAWMRSENHSELTEVHYVSDSDEDEISTALRNSFELSDNDDDVEESPTPQKYDRSPPLRNAPPKLPFIFVPSCTINGQFIRHGDCVQILQEEDAKHPYIGDFMKISAILKNLECDEITLRGLCFRRNERFGGAIPDHSNDVCLILHVAEDDGRNGYEQGQEEIPVERVGRKRELKITHEPYPFNSQPERLVCRYIKTSVHPDAAALRSFQKAFEKLRKKERDEEKKDTVKECHHGILRHFQEEDINTLMKWLQQSGSSDYLQMRTEVNQQFTLRTHGIFAERHIHTVDTVRITASSNLRSTPVSPRNVKIKKITYADICCGCGCATRAAIEALLRVCWGCEKDKNVRDTWRLNFPNRKCYRDALELMNIPEDLRVNILHISFPCKFWSWAKTVPTSDPEKDKANRAIIFAVYHILCKVQPDICTFEQTTGFFHKSANASFFYRFLGEIIRAGYSVSWKIIDFKNYGLPQSRKRLIIYAARNGVPLPKFPKPTGPPCYIHDALFCPPIGPRATHNDRKFYRPDKRKQPYDDKKTILGTICCSGPDQSKPGGCFPDGTRPFTDREIARLQGIQDNHEFLGTATEVKKMIGDAVPTKAWVPFLLECKKVLEGEDNDTLGSTAERLIRLGEDSPYGNTSMGAASRLTDTSSSRFSTLDNSPPARRRQSIQTRLTPHFERQLRPYLYTPSPTHGVKRERPDSEPQLQGSQRARTEPETPTPRRSRNAPSAVSPITANTEPKRKKYCTGSCPDRTQDLDDPDTIWILDD